jgi:hypothetical protein
MRAIGYRVGLRGLKGLALAALCVGGALAATDPQQKLVFQSYIQSPSYRAILEKGYNDAEPAVLRAECPVLKLKSLDPPDVVMAPQFAKGIGGWTAVDGAWVQRATLDRCGKTVMRRTMAEMASNNALRTHKLLPGEYGGDYKLESTIVPGVLGNAIYKLHCREHGLPQVLEIKRVSRPNPNWNEVWTLYLCGKKATAHVAYYPRGYATDMMTTGIAYTK